MGPSVVPLQELSGRCISRVSPRPPKPGLILWAEGIIILMRAYPGEFTCGYSRSGWFKVEGLKSSFRPGKTAYWYVAKWRKQKTWVLLLVVLSIKNICSLFGHALACYFTMAAYSIHPFNSWLSHCVKFLIRKYLCCYTGIRPGNSCDLNWISYDFKLKTTWLPA